MQECDSFVCDGEICTDARTGKMLISLFVYVVECGPKGGGSLRVRSECGRVMKWGIKEIEN